MTKLFAFGICALVTVSQAAAQTATVELVAGAVATTGTVDDRTFRILKEGDRLVAGTRIHLGNEARVVLIQVVPVPGGPPGGRKLCVTWVILGGVERFTVRNVRLTPSRGCPVSPANIRLTDAGTAPPFVQHLAFHDFEHDKADLLEPPMLTRVRAAVDTMRVVGQAPDRDLSVSHTLAGDPPAPLSIAGAATNRSNNFYPCVRLQFGLLKEGADGQLVRVDTAIITLRRIRARETRKYQQEMKLDAAVTLESIGPCS